MRRDPQLFAIRPDALLSRPVHQATIPSTPDPTPSPREHPAEIRKPAAGTRGGHAPHPTMPRPGGRLSRAVGPVATRRCSVVRAVRRLTNGCPDAGSASRHVPTAPTESRRSTSPPVTPAAGSGPRRRPRRLTPSNGGRGSRAKITAVARCSTGHSTSRAAAGTGTGRRPHAGFPRHRRGAHHGEARAPCRTPPGRRRPPFSPSLQGSRPRNRRARPLAVRFTAVRQRFQQTAARFRRQPKRDAEAQQARYGKQP